MIDQDGSDQRPAARTFTQERTFRRAMRDTHAAGWPIAFALWFCGYGWEVTRAGEPRYRAANADRFDGPRAR